jgi:hypothetical protein
MRKLTINAEASEAFDFILNCPSGAVIVIPTTIGEIQAIKRGIVAAKGSSRAQVNTWLMMAEAFATDADAAKLVRMFNRMHAESVDAELLLHATSLFMGRGIVNNNLETNEGPQ